MENNQEDELKIKVPEWMKIVMAELNKLE